MITKVNDYCPIYSSMQSVPIDPSTVLKQLLQQNTANRQTNSIAKTPQVSHADSRNFIHASVRATMYAMRLLGLVIIVISHIHSSLFPFVLIINQHRSPSAQSALAFIHRAAPCPFAIDLV